MKVKARFFAHFRDLFGGRERELVLGGGATVGDALSVLADTAERRRELFAGRELKPYVVVMVNGAPIASRGGLSSPLADGDILAVFPFIGGG